MKKIMFLAVLELCMLMGFTVSCSKDETDTVLPGTMSYFNGTYSGEDLVFVIDDQTVSSVKADVLISGDEAKITIHGWPGASETVVWNAMLRGVNWCDGDFTDFTGKKYHYDVTFLVDLYGCHSCKILCFTEGAASSHKLHQ